jgi:hypothetical protein
MKLFSPFFAALLASQSTISKTAGAQDQTKAREDETILWL